MTNLNRFVASCCLAIAALLPANGATVTFTPDTLRVLRNPLQGWVMYLGRTWDEDFFRVQGYDNMLTSTGDTVRVSDYASCAYIRTSWASLEPAEGDYAWLHPESRIMRLLKAVSDRGLRVAMRIVIDGRDQGQNTPQYVFDAGAEGYTDPKNPGNNLSPYPDDPVFQEKYAIFMRALAKEFDNPAKVEFIDAYSLGKWGESHSMIYKDNANKRPVFDWITGLATECFKKVPMLIHYHRMLGDPADDGWGSVPADADSLITTAVAKGFSLRHDAFGMNGYYQEWEKDMAAKWRFRRPIVMEGGWITGAHHRYWRDPSGSYRQGHAEDVRRGEFEASRQAHVNMMDLRINDETRSWFEDAFPLVKAFVAQGGYRLYPRVASVPGVCCGDTATVGLRIANHGWGYCPTNIPQWDQCYKPAVALIDRSGRRVRTEVLEQADLSKIVKGSDGVYISRMSLDSLAEGTYIWAVALVDTRLPDTPAALEMAVESERITPDGWVRISEVEIK